MKRNFLFLILLSFVACTNEIVLQDEKEAAGEPQQIIEQLYEEGYVRILVSEDLSDKMETTARSGGLRSAAMAADDIVSQVKIRSMERTFPYAGRFEERTRKAGLHLWYDVIFDTEVPIHEAKQNLSAVRGVRKVEYRPVAARYWDDSVVEYTNQIAQGIVGTRATTFNDPQLNKQWHYQNDGSLGGNFRKGADINLFNAWDYTTGSPEVIVAVIDGGVDYTHEDLAANMWVNSAEKNGTSSLDDDKNGYIDDIHGYNFVSNIGKLVPHNHGTHVAGTVAAVSNNGKGVAGIAGGNGQNNTGVRIMSCQIFVNDDDPYAGSTGRKGASAIKYAADNGAVVCQNSWGYPTLTETPASDKAAIDYFITYAGIDENGQQTGPMRGGIVIFAAGNENRTAAAPGNYEKVVAVSSIAPDFRKAYYSNFGNWVDLAAPGGDVQSFGNTGTVLSTIVNGYGYMQGTSMACPHVSGVAALVLSHFKRSGYNPDMLRARLESSATNIDDYNSSYRGRLGKLVNAHAALAGGSTTPPNSVGTVTGSVKSNIVTLKWAVPRDPDDTKASGFNVYYRKTPLTGLNVNNPPADVMIRSFSTGNHDVGETFEAEIKGLDFETRYYFVVNAFDFSGNFSPLSAQVSQTTLSNSLPSITIVDSVDVKMKPHQNVILRFSGNDPDGHELFWDLKSSLAGVALVDMGDNTAQVTITGVQAQVGENRLELVLSDEYGASVTQEIKFEVQPNRAPVIVQSMDDFHIGALNKEISLSIADYFKDEDNELLRYTFTNTAPHIVNVNENMGQLYIVSIAYGLADITVTATDAVGLSVSQQFKVLVRDSRQEIDVYPNPVKDFVWLRTGEDQRCSVAVINNAGVKMFEGELDISPFSPAKIDMSTFSGGAYAVIIKYGNKEIKKQIIKL
ncbi:S8 family serine peptidase [Proteiniphilum sp.]|uniref:S8 family serine peptidase n=1 Tax=Proteiniphilum sp. TaxID=1926877 RepID=UPI002B2019D5|nr:S8 family serine peptidase [Proteiniphilum sp.]MEA4916239.1 S8 family serine peptidase [Proteiniphilum sp.]